MKSEHAVSVLLIFFHLNCLSFFQKKKNAKSGFKVSSLIRFLQTVSACYVKI